MAKIHVLSFDRLLAQRITDAMGERASVELAQSIDDIEPEGPGLIVLDHAALPAERPLGHAIAAVDQAAQGRAIVLATEDLYAAQVLQAIRAGAADVISRKADRDELAAILLRVLNSAILSQGTLGRMTLVLGPDQEATAIAATDMALACNLAQTPTLLIDCTLPSSTAEAYLDLKVEYGIASAVSDIDRMDTNFLADALTRHEASGLSLLTLDGGTGGEPAGLAPNDIVGLVQLLRACCGDVVLCAGSLRHGGLLRELASQAQAIEIVCSQSIRELDACRRLLDRVALDTASTERARLLVWDHDPRILLDGRRMADVLRVGAVMALSMDRIRLRNSLNAGQPLALQKNGNGYMQAIRRICDIAAPSGATGSGFAKVRRAILRSVERAG